MSSNTNWFVEIGVEENRDGLYFLAQTVPANTRLSQAEGATRIYAPRIDHKGRKNQETRYMIVEGQPLDSSYFFYCTGENCDHRPSWMADGQSHRAVGLFPCQMEVAIDIAAGLLDPRLDNETDDISECRSHGHVAVYNNGWTFTADHENLASIGSVGADMNSAFRNFGEDAVRKYWATEDRRREEYAASFVPKPCPVCGHPPQPQR